MADHGDAPVLTEDDLEALPASVRRFFSGAVAVGTPLAAGARLYMRGRIKLGRWVPFRARQLLVPHHGTVWEARVGGVITGSDQYVDGTGGMDWKLLGRVPVMRAEGEDVSRSAAERAAGESIWVPTAVFPGHGGTWSAAGDDLLEVAFDVDGHPVRLLNEVDDRGRLRRSTFSRWGDPDNTGVWRQLPFGVEVGAHRTFDGVTIPSAGRAGWHIGTDRWETGEFFRFELTGYELLTPETMSG